MVVTKNQMAKMMVNENFNEDLDLKNIRTCSYYNNLDLGENSISDWFYGKRYTFYQYRFSGQSYSRLKAYDENGKLMFEQQLNYHIHQFYIDEDGYFYGVTSSSQLSQDFKLTLFNRIEEENTIYKRKSYTLPNNNLTKAPYVTKKDDSNYFIASVEANVGGYRTMIIWQLTIDIKNGNQIKYWQNEFDHDKDNAEIKYSFDFSVENSTIIRFFFAEISTTSGSTTNRHVQIERANLLLTDEDLNEQRTQKKTKLLLTEVLEDYDFYLNYSDNIPKNFIRPIDNNLFATLKITRNGSTGIPSYAIQYWMQEEEESLYYVSQTINIETEVASYIAGFSWYIDNKIMVVVVPNIEGTDISGESKSCKIYTYMIEFEQTNNVYDPIVFPYIPTFHLCMNTISENENYLEHDFGYLQAYSGIIDFKMINVIKIKERWYVTIGVVARIQQTSSSAIINRAVNLIYPIDNVWEMKKDDFCNVPELMQVNDAKSLLAKMQTQYYEGSELVSVFNIPNNIENGIIRSLIFRDKYDQNFCGHATNIEKNEFENVYINHRTKYKVLNDGVENTDASILACNVLTKEDKGLTRWLPYIRFYRVTMEGQEPVEEAIQNHYTINNNVITFIIPHENGRGKVEILGNIASSISKAPVYYTKKFNGGTSTTITCTIN